MWSRDILAFQKQYPNVKDDTDITDNLRFYQNQLRSRPDNKLISEIHADWRGDYNRLERLHGYIQWLFPLREPGMNWDAFPLQVHERDAMRDDPVVIERVLESYRLMLDFYGMNLVDEKSGKLERTGGYQERYRNLVSHPHNFLRISRILKHLSEMNLEHLNAGFLLFLLNEQSEHGQLASSTLIDSMDRFWRGCIRDTQLRETVCNLIDAVRSGELRFSRSAYEESLGA